MTTGSRMYSFGEFRLDARRRILLRDGEPLALTPKALDTLLYLVEHPGIVLGKDELMHAIWPDTVVEESNLSQNVYTLRRTLGEGRGENHYIATVPGRGYQFIAEVTPLFTKAESDSVEVNSDSREDAPNVADVIVPAASTDTRRASLWLFTLLLVVTAVAIVAFILRRGGEPQPSHGIRSIAIIPFKPLVEDTRDESLELGMADSMIAKLGGIEQISVTPLSAVRRYASGETDLRQVGTDLRVDAVLDGSIQRWGDRVRVTARLVRVADGRQLWSGQFDEKFTDIFAVQDAISDRVVSELALELTGAERARLAEHPTVDPEAYELYLKGRFFWSKRTYEATLTAIGYFEEALQLDPRYAMAYAGLADCYRGMPIRGDVRPREAFPKGKDAALRALEIDETLADAHTALGWILFFHDWEWERSQQHFRRAVESNPRDALAMMGSAHVLSTLGKHDDALRMANQGLRLEPLSPYAGSLNGMFLYHAGRYSEAVGQLQKTLEIDPAFWIAHVVLSQVYQSMGMHAEALAALRTAESSSGGITQPTALIGYTLAKTGQTREAESILRHLQTATGHSYVPPYHLALLHLALGRPDDSLGLLEKAYEDRDVHMVFLASDPKWQPLRGEPRFRRLIAMMNLPDGSVKGP